MGDPGQAHARSWPGGADPNFETTAGGRVYMCVGRKHTGGEAIIIRAFAQLFLFYVSQTSDLKVR